MTKLTLHAKPSNWERFNQRKSRAVFQKVREKILARDKETCVFCALHAKNLEVINLDNDYGNNLDSNLASACTFCARCTLLDSYPLDYAGQDKIIYLPELRQEQVNQLCQITFIKMREVGEVGYNAKMVYAQLKDRADWLNQRTQSEIAHPGIFVNYLNGPERDLSLIQKLRWLPSPETYEAELNEWEASLSAEPEEEY